METKKRERGETGTRILLRKEKTDRQRRLRERVPERKKCNVNTRKEAKAVEARKEEKVREERKGKQ